MPMRVPQYGWNGDWLTLGGQQAPQKPPEGTEKP
jgi:hypothetical protein